MSKGQVWTWAFSTTLQGHRNLSFHNAYPAGYSPQSDHNAKGSIQLPPEHCSSTEYKPVNKTKLSEKVGTVQVVESMDS